MLLLPTSSACCLLARAHLDLLPADLHVVQPAAHHLHDGSRTWPLQSSEDGSVPTAQLLVGLHHKWLRSQAAPGYKSGDREGDKGSKHHAPPLTVLYCEIFVIFIFSVSWKI